MLGFGELQPGPQEVKAIRGQRLPALPGKETGQSDNRPGNSSSTIFSNGKGQE